MLQLLLNFKLEIYDISLTNCSRVRWLYYMVSGLNTQRKYNNDCMIGHNSAYVSVYVSKISFSFDT